MKAILASAKAMAASIKTDRMLQLCCLAPFLCGCFFRFGIPWLDALLKSALKLTTLLSPYASLFDLFFASLTPMLFCYVLAMVVLEERDEHIALSLCVTPLTKRGYLFSRLGVPALFSFAVTALLLPVFALGEITLLSDLLLCACGAMQALLIALLVVSLSKNKLEGLAVTKMASLLMLGLFAPYFIPSRAMYVFAFLPSFWMAKATQNGAFALVSLLLSTLFVLPLVRRFARRLAA